MTLTPEFITALVAALAAGIALIVKAVLDGRKLADRTTKPEAGEAMAPPPVLHFEGPVYEIPRLVMAIHSKVNEIDEKQDETLKRLDQVLDYLAPRRPRR